MNLHRQTRTHTKRPNLDLLLQEVDFVLLLQELLLLPGNLRTAQNAQHVISIQIQIYGVFLCACVHVCVQGLWEMQHIGRSLRPRLHDRGSMPCYEILKSAFNLVPACSQTVSKYSRCIYFCASDVHFSRFTSSIKMDKYISVTPTWINY